MKILISGGAGFVGSSLARAFQKENPQNQLVIFDNLKRRGSEMNLLDFKKRGIQFHHGDIRLAQDLADVTESYGRFDLFIDASAEPSVLAGLDGNPNYVIQTNLVGTLNSLEFARKNCGAFLLISTSRVYSIEPLKSISLREEKSRFELNPHQVIPGVSERGVNENFPCHLSRSLYGATKLASEVIAQEYSQLYGLPIMINRCGVIAGPGQFGKVDQGVFTHWVMSHILGKPLSYTGFGGQGKQVRDLLHPDDLFSLIKAQFEQVQSWKGDIYNVGGGRRISLSMRELTELCQRATHRTVEIAENPATSAVDIPVYITDTAQVEKRFGWKPRIEAEDLIQSIASWVIDSQDQLLPLLKG